MSKDHLSIKTTFGHPKGGRIRQVSLYINFLIILLIPTPLVLALFCSSIPISLLIFKNVFRSLIMCRVALLRGTISPYRHVTLVVLHGVPYRR